MTGNNYRYLSIFMVTILVISMSVAFIGIGAADRTADLEDGDRYWLGQVLEYELGEDEEDMRNAEVVTSDGDFVSELSVTNDSVSIDTESSDFESGSYNLTYDYTDTSEEDSDENRTVSFELSNQSFSVDVEDVQVNNEGDDTETEFVLDSNRNTYNVTVSAENLSDEDLSQIFSAGDYDFDEDDVEDGQLTLAEVPSDLNADFDGIDADDYTFTFDVVDTTASDTVDVTVSELGDATTSFVSVDSIAEGDVSEIVVEYENTDEFDIVVGDDDDVGYELNVTVSDLDDDESEVTLLFDSYVAGNDDGDVLSVHEDYDGTVNVNNETNLSDPLVPETYDLSVFTGGSENDVSSLNIVERSTTGVNTHVLPQDADVDELEDIEQATQSDVLAEEDILVLEVEMDGVYSFLNESYDLTKDEDNTHYSDHGLFAEIVQVDDSPNAPSPDPIDMTGATIHTNSADGVFYIVFDDTSASEFAFDEDSVHYDVEVGLSENSQYVEDEDDEESVEVSFNSEERNTEFVGFNDDDVLEFEEGNEFVVTAETNVAENTEDTLTVRKTGDGSFVNTYDVTVEEGEFSSSVNGESLSVGDEFTVRINGETDRVDAIIVDGTDDDGTDDDGTDDDGTDDDGTDDDGTDDDGTDDDGTDDDGTDDDGTDDDGTDDDGTDDDSTTDVTDDDTPGFGALVALVALIVAALLAVRRNNN